MASSRASQVSSDPRVASPPRHNIVNNPTSGRDIVSHRSISLSQHRLCLSSQFLRDGRASCSRHNLFSPRSDLLREVHRRCSSSSIRSLRKRRRTRRIHTACASPNDGYVVCERAPGVEKKVVGEREEPWRYDEESEVKL
jgi:hypothetical protein